MGGNTKIADWRVAHHFVTCLSMINPNCGCPTLRDFRGVGVRNINVLAKRANVNLVDASDRQGFCAELTDVDTAKIATSYSSYKRLSQLRIEFLTMTLPHATMIL